MIDLTLVGPEAPLCAGIVDEFQGAGLKILGLHGLQRKLKVVKWVAKEIMAKYGIPTARYAVFSDPGEAVAYIKKTGVPCVIKADGLAAGKGVIIALDEQTASGRSKFHHGR